MRLWLKPTALKRMFFFLSVDTLLSFVTLKLSYLLRFNFDVPPSFSLVFWHVFGSILLFKLLALYALHSYQVVWRFFGLSDAKAILKAHLIAYTLFGVLYWLYPEPFSPFARSVILIDFTLSLLLIGAMRLAKRLWQEGQLQQEAKPTLIIGVNSKTTTIIHSALKGEIPYYPMAILALDDLSRHQDSYIGSVPIYPEEVLEEIVRRLEIEAVIFTKPLTQVVLKALVERLNQLGIDEMKQVKLLGAKDEKLEDLSIEDLLARRPQDLDTKAIAEVISGKSVLITGAGGSIGSEIARQCDAFGASRLILVDHSEFNLYQIGEQLPHAVLKLQSITNKALFEHLFEEEKPDIVIHAAAYKHVPVCEENQESAVWNNVWGSKVVIDVSIAYGVDKVVIISTDKAVRPTNVMGATKRVVELYANNVQREKTEIVAVRFGNVLGSSGSVIPKFKQQIERGGPVTVTHPEITRYFMLIPEACQLVLQTASIAKGGELFILDMGEPIKIVDLAKQMIRLYGKEDEVEICFTGLRKGEKLYEELLLDESEQKTKYHSIFIARPTFYDITQLTHDIEILLSSQNKVEALQKIVPEFTREEVTPAGKNEHKRKKRC